MNVSCIGVIKKAFHGERHERVKGEAWPPTLSLLEADLKAYCFSRVGAGGGTTV